MKKSVSLLSVVILAFMMTFLANDASAQRRYKHLKRVRTPEGFVQKTKKEKPAQNEVRFENKAEQTPVTSEIIKEENEVAVSETPAADQTAVATSENKKAKFKTAIKQVKVKDLFTEEKLAETASTLVYSSSALSKSGLGKMLSPEKTSEMKPGMLFIIIGSVMAGLAIIMWIVGTVVFLGAGYNAWIYILFIVLGVLLWFGGLAMIAVGIVKLIRHNRGR